MKILVIIITIFVYTITAYSQVVVIPNIIFIDPLNKTGSVTLRNNSTEEREVDISFKYGYMGIDTTGNQLMIYDTTNPINSLSASIVSFPKRLLLAPNGEQTVRLLVRGMTDVPDGAYWTRLSVKTQTVAKQIDSTSKEKISADFIFVMETMNPVLYYKGKVESGIDITEVKSIEEEEKRKLQVGVRRKGNAPFFGMAEITIYDINGKQVESQIVRATAYFDNYVSFYFEKDVLKAGKYKADIKFNNIRDDIPDDKRIEFKDEVKKIEFEI